MARALRGQAAPLSSRRDRELVSLRSGSYRFRAFRGVRLGDWCEAGVNSARRAQGMYQKWTARRAGAGVGVTTPGGRLKPPPSTRAAPTGRPADQELGPSTYHEPQPGASAPPQDPPGRGTCCPCSGSCAGPSPAKPSRGRCGLAVRLIERSWKSLTGGGRSRPGGGRATHDAHPGRRPPPRFVSGGRGAPPRREDSQLGGARPAPARLPSPLPSPPPARLRPLPAAGTHSAPMMSFGGNLPCSKTGIIQRSRGARGAGGGGSRACGRWQNLPGRGNCSQGRNRGGVCGKVAPKLCVGRVGVVGVALRPMRAVAAPKIRNSAFRLTAGAKGKEKSFRGFSAAPAPSTMMDTSVAVKRVTRTRGTREPQPRWEDFGKNEERSALFVDEIIWNEVPSCFGGWTERRPGCNWSRKDCCSQARRRAQKLTRGPSFFRPSLHINTIGHSGGDFLMASPKNHHRWWIHLNREKFIQSHKRCVANSLFA